MLPAILPFVFAVLWASTYIGAKVGLTDITPYAFVAVRLTIAAVAALGFVLVMKRPLAPLKPRFWHLVIGGALVHGLALSVAHKALLNIGATPLALVHAFHPILTAALSVLLLGERFAWWQWIGVALGLIGVVLGVPRDADTSTLALVGTSLFGLCAGTLYLKKFAADVPPFEATAVQLIGGAALSIALMVLFEAPHARWTSELVAAMAWNVVVMSIFGMAIYNLMIDRCGAAKAASGFFIVPGASALIAWLLIDEHLRPIVLVGLACATLGVVLVWWKPRAARS